MRFCVFIVHNSVFSMLISTSIIENTSCLNEKKGLFENEKQSCEQWNFFANFVWQMATTKHSIDLDIGTYKTVQKIQVAGRQLKVGD